MGLKVDMREEESSYDLQRKIWRSKDKNRDIFAKEGKHQRKKEHPYGLFGETRARLICKDIEIGAQVSSKRLKDSWMAETTGWQCHLSGGTVGQDDDDYCVTGV